MQTILLSTLKWKPLQLHKLNLIQYKDSFSHNWARQILSQPFCFESSLIFQKKRSLALMIDDSDYNQAVVKFLSS